MEEWISVCPLLASMERQPQLSGVDGGACFPTCNEGVRRAFDCLSSSQGSRKKSEPLDGGGEVQVDGEAEETCRYTFPRYPLQRFEDSLPANETHLTLNKTFTESSI